MEKIKVKNKEEYLKAFRENAGPISYLILYCALLATDEDNDFYYGMLMTLCTRICMLSYLSCDEEIERKEFYSAINLVHRQSQISNLIHGKRTLVNWSIENLSDEETEQLYFNIYRCSIDYLSKLFCQMKVNKEGTIWAHPLTCVLNQIFLKKGNLPIIDLNAFCEKRDPDPVPCIPDAFTPNYIPKEWEDKFEFPIDYFDLDTAYEIDIGTASFRELIKKRRDKNS